MVNLIVHLKWGYLKYVLTAISVFVCATFLSSASILESATIGAISGIFSFWLDKLFELPTRFLGKMAKKKDEIIKAKDEHTVKTTNVL